MNPMLPKFFSRFLHGRLWRKRSFESFDAAQRAAGSRGYFDDDLVAARVDSVLRNLDTPAGEQPLELTSIEASLLSVVLLLRREGSPFRVIDLGGGPGKHFFLLRRAIPRELDLEWHVVETPAMVNQARRLAGEGLFFHDSLGAAYRGCPQPALFFSARTLQCLPDPLHTLDQITQLGPPAILLCGLNLFEGKGERSDMTVLESIWLRQYYGGVLPDGKKDKKILFPITFSRLSSFTGRLEKRYRLDTLIRDRQPEQFWVDDEKIKLHHLSILARKRN